MSLSGLHVIMECLKAVYYYVSQRASIIMVRSTLHSFFSLLFDIKAFICHKGNLSIEAIHAVSAALWHPGEHCSLRSTCTNKHTAIRTQ